MYGIHKFTVVSVKYFLVFSAVLPFTTPNVVTFEDQCSWVPSSSVLFRQDCIPEISIDEDLKARVANRSPWTQSRSCKGPYCIFMEGDHALSIITTHERMASKLGEFEALFSARSVGPPSPQQHSTHLWEVRDVEGKGKGVIALSKIPRGDFVMVDSASLLVDTELSETIGRDIGQGLVTQAVQLLPNSAQILDLSRSWSGTSPAAEDILRTNSYDIRFGGIRYAALFPNLSRINHACVPNVDPDSAYIRLDSTTLAQDVVALKDIEPGEEITVSYLDFGLPYKTRQDTLRRWGFKCTCHLCSASPEERRESDQRRQRIQSIRSDILSRVRGKDYLGAIELQEESMRLDKKEKLVVHLGGSYEVLARLHAAIPNRRRAIHYTRLALGEMRAYGGPEAYDSITELQEMLDQMERLERGD